MIKQHSSILCYNKINLNIPIVLIIGREPNNDSIGDGKMGLYDFDDHPRCGFWNMAFHLMNYYSTNQHGNNTNHTSSYKKIMRSKGCCPLVFTDTLTRGIKNSRSNKYTIRQCYENDFQKQIEIIFKQKDLLNRVELVLLSGLEDDLYDKFKSQFELRWSKLYSAKPITCIKFLYGGNMGDIKSQIDSNQLVKNKIIEINNQYFKK